jgi:D-glycero-D-manno-heptose 1,7-bisphosphate phosphatase
VKQQLGKRAVILDRDGTIVVDRGYLSDPEQLEFLPGAAEALRELHQRGFRLVIATNQSGVGRGMYTLDRLHEVHQKLRQMVRSAGSSLEAIYYCPHTPEADCSCRKPATGLLLRAASELAFDPAAALVIGDKLTDVEFGQRAGAVTVLISATGLPEDAEVTPDLVVPTLGELTHRIDRLQRLR